MALYARNSAAVDFLVGTGSDGGSGGRVRDAFGNFRCAIFRFFRQDFQWMVSDDGPKSRP